MVLHSLVNVLRSPRNFAFANKNFIRTTFVFPPIHSQNICNRSQTFFVLLRNFAYAHKFCVSRAFTYKTFAFTRITLLTKFLPSPEKRCIRMLNICICLQNFLISLGNLHACTYMLAKVLHFFKKLCWLTKLLHSLTTCSLRKTLHTFTKVLLPQETPKMLAFTHTNFFFAYALKSFAFPKEM